MNESFVARRAPKPRGGADRLFDAMDLSDERDIPLTADEVLNAPLDYLRERLVGKGLAPLPGTQNVLDALMALEAQMPRDVAFEPDIDDFETVEPATLLDTQTKPDIRRPHLVKRVAEELANQQFVYLCGPVGSGKSFFVKRQLLPSAAIQSLFYRSLFMDCRILQMREPKQLAREAVWAQFEGYDYSFRTFLAEVTESRAERADADTATGVDILVEYLQRRFADRNGRRGLIVLDHIDALDETGAIDAWMHRSLLPAVEALSLCVLLIGHSPKRRKVINLRAQERAIQYPCATVPEIDAWLSTSGIRSLHGKTVTAGHVIALTGGRPSLLDDLRVFLLTSPPNPLVLRRFFSRRRDAGHLSDCDEFIRVARRYPRFWQSVLEAQGDLSRKLDIPEDCRRHLLTTGALRERADQSLTYVSYLHRARMRVLTSWEALATAMARGDRIDIHENGAGTSIRKFGEYAADPMAKCIAAERDATAAFKAFLDYLRTLGFRAKLYLRDRGNARLWYPFATPERVGPFECRLQPDFARAIQTGECVRCEDGRWIIPIAGNSGFLEMVLWVSPQQSLMPFAQMVRLQALRRLVTGMQPTLAQVFQRWELQRDHIFSRKVTARTRHSGGRSRNALLRAAGCELIAVLNRSTAGDWTIVKLEWIIGGAKRDAARIDLNPFEVIRGARLSGIAQHPSGRGLVLSGDDLWHVFPQLLGQKAAIYMHPIIHDDRIAQIVAFLFVDENATGLTGMIQSHLSVVAPALAAASF